MEKVWCKAKTGFVNRWLGSVVKKQRLLLDKAVADQFVNLGLVEYESAQDGGEAKKPEKAVQSEAQTPTTQESKQSQEAETDGKAQPSASLQAETASPKAKSEKPKFGRPPKTGK
jgi:flagellar motor protein MotB